MSASSLVLSTLRVMRNLKCLYFNLTPEIRQCLGPFEDLGQKWTSLFPHLLSHVHKSMITFYKDKNCNKIKRFYKWFSLKYIFLWKSLFSQNMQIGKHFHIGINGRKNRGWEGATVLRKYWWLAILQQEPLNSCYEIDYKCKYKI